MPRQEFDNLISNARMKLLFADDDGALFSDGAFARFFRGRLQFARRPWYLLNGNLDAFQSFAALGSFADRYRPPVCTISHAPLANPKMQSDNVLFLCGQRSIELSETRAG